MDSFDALVHQAGRRAKAYWLLSKLCLDVPTAPMLAELKQTLAQADPTSAPVELAQLLHAIDGALSAGNEAAVAFTRHLTLGDRKTGEPLPFEAHVREGCLPGKCTEEVASAMQQAGFGDVAPEAPSPDHLGAELRFMALLCHREFQAWSSGDRAGAAEALQTQRRFQSGHLAQWVPDYCSGLAGRTTNAYLQAVAKLTAVCIDEDAVALGEICEWLCQEEADAAAIASGMKAPGQACAPAHDSLH